MSGFDWDTYNATKDSPAGAVHATKVDWTEYLPSDDYTEEGIAAPSVWQIAPAIGFVIAIVFFFIFMSAIV